MSHVFSLKTHSLTRAECTTPVTWVVMGNVKKISANAMDKFLLLKSPNGRKISEFGNYRPLQSLGSRKVCVCVCVRDRERERRLFLFVLPFLLFSPLLILLSFPSSSDPCDLAYLCVKYRMNSIVHRA